MPPARILLKIGAIQIRPAEPFTLTSGRLSPVYVDCRKIISYPAERAQIIDMALLRIKSHIENSGLDVIAGGETAGIPFAAWIAERLALPMVYVRKKPKGFGRMAQIEGDLPPGSRVLLVEDLATDGRSKAVFVAALRHAQARINHILVVFHYGIYPQSPALMRDLGVDLLALAQWSDILAAGEADGTFNPQTAAQIRSFLANPQDGPQALSSDAESKEDQ